MDKLLAVVVVSVIVVGLVVAVFATNLGPAANSAGSSLKTDVTTVCVTSTGTVTQSATCP